jgi:hypothetical protein
VRISNPTYCTLYLSSAHFAHIDTFDPPSPLKGEEPKTGKNRLRLLYVTVRSRAKKGLDTKTTLVGRGSGPNAFLVLGPVNHAVKKETLNNWRYTELCLWSRIRDPHVSGWEVGWEPPLTCPVWRCYFRSARSANPWHWHGTSAGSRYMEQFLCELVLLIIFKQSCVYIISICLGMSWSLFVEAIFTCSEARFTAMSGHTSVILSM